LAPRDDAQKWFQAQALQLANELAQARSLLITQLQGNDLPMPLLIVLIVWTTAIFISFGRFVRMNSTVTIALFVSALAVAAAILLIPMSPARPRMRFLRCWASSQRQPSTMRGLRRT
jgi:hypothetical protein